MTSIPNEILASSQQQNGDHYNTTFEAVLSTVNASSHQSIAHQHGCVEIVLSQMEYIPWDNPDNVISAAVLNVIFRTRNNVLVLLFLAGGSGNIINMAIFCKQGLKERVNLCLFALALADGLTLLTHAVYYGEQFVLQFTTKENPGPVQAFLMNNHFLGVVDTFGYVSSVLSAIIALERCHCVLHPLSYQTAMRTKTMAAIIVTVCVLVTALMFIVMGFRISSGCIYDPETGVLKKTVIPSNFYKAHKQVLQILRSIILGFVLPIVLIVVVLVSTIITSVKLRHIVKWRSAVTQSLSSREVGLTKMLIASSILFISCSLPWALLRNVSFLFPAVDVGGRNENLFFAGIQICQMFTYVNASFNIFVFYVMGARYRQSFWELFGRKTSKGVIMNEVNKA